MTLQQRADAFAAAFPKYPAAWPRLVEEGGKPVMYATWVLGADSGNPTSCGLCTTGSKRGAASGPRRM